jgi:hypothetical protein
MSTSPYRRRRRPISRKAGTALKSATVPTPFTQFQSLSLSFPAIQIDIPPRLPVLQTQPEPVVQPSDRIIAAGVRALAELIATYPKEAAIVLGVAALCLWYGSDSASA